LGFAAFLASLAYVAALRTVEKEERLTALDKELEIARKIQLSILPRQMPRLPGLAIDARCVPMTAVAGDFFDFLVLDERRIGILVADVSGHGVPAALIASMVKVAIAGQLQHAHDPSRVLAGLNQVVCAGKLKGQFVTAAYLFVDLEGGILRYAGAGHPPLLWWHSAEKTVDTLTQNGLALGFRAGTAYPSIERKIATGDRFLLYTDGLLEAMNEIKEQFGDARVQEHFEAGQGLTLLLEKLGRWAGYDRGRPAEDDLTVLWIALSDSPG